MSACRQMRAEVLRLGAVKGRVRQARFASPLSVRLLRDQPTFLRSDAFDGAMAAAAASALTSVSSTVSPAPSSTRLVCACRPARRTKLHASRPQALAEAMQPSGKHDCLRSGRLWLEVNEPCSSVMLTPKGGPCVGDMHGDLALAQLQPAALARAMRRNRHIRGGSCVSSSGRCLIRGGHTLGGRLRPR